MSDREEFMGEDRSPLPEEQPARVPDGTPPQEWSGPLPSEHLSRGQHRESLSHPVTSPFEGQPVVWTMSTSDLALRETLPGTENTRPRIADLAFSPTVPTTRRSA